MVQITLTKLKLYCIDGFSDKTLQICTCHFSRLIFISQISLINTEID